MYRTGLYDAGRTRTLRTSDGAEIERKRNPAEAGVFRFPRARISTSRSGGFRWNRRRGRNRNRRFETAAFRCVEQSGERGGIGNPERGQRGRLFLMRFAGDEAGQFFNFGFCLYVGGRFFSQRLFSGGQFFDGGFRVHGFSKSGDGGFSIWRKGKSARSQPRKVKSRHRGREKPHVRKEPEPEQSPGARAGTYTCRTKVARMPPPAASNRIAEPFSAWSVLHPAVPAKTWPGGLGKRQRVPRLGGGKKTRPPA